MDIWTVLKACVRRWYVFLPVLGLAAWVAYSQAQSMPPVYVATSTATIAGPALIPGDEAGEIIEVNPFERLGGSLNATGQVMTSLMDSGPKRDQYAVEGVTADYEVSRDDAVIYFDVLGEDPDAVVTSAARLVELLDTELAALQGRAVEAPDSRVRAVPLSVPATADEDPMGGLRVLAILAAIGLILAVAAALVTDALVQARRRRADAAPPVVPPAARPRRRLPLGAGRRPVGAPRVAPSSRTSGAAPAVPSAPSGRPSTPSGRSGPAGARRPTAGPEDVTQPLAVTEDPAAHAPERPSSGSTGSAPAPAAPGAQEGETPFSPVGQAGRHSSGA